ncbi:Cholesterol oxidase [BD1-7 clade bacterium]|uniref:Cholesterol oxidase n=1 Tax=BD1-7 clade bacterium TaxID=2029982 RepID=A0A5S9QXG3_9GAMM|nr:Cholesterol oxidase [BD1-7 clade bacterium]
MTNNSRVSRRGFIKAGALASAAVGASKAVSAGTTPQSAIVIGSGFGGAVSALRLAQKGITTTVIERGRHWDTDSDNPYPGLFPTSTDPDGRCGWLSGKEELAGLAHVDVYTGLLERVKSWNLDALCGAGVGGGSLVFGGALVQPKREVFDTVFPTEVNYDLLDQYYYPLVRNMLGADTIPDHVLASSPYKSMRTFEKNMEKAGFTVERTHAGFDWNIITDEINGTVPAAATASQYSYGCESGAKNSVNKNYLQQATATGLVTIKALHQVTDIVERPQGGYYVHIEVLDDVGNTTDSKTLETDLLVLAAGSLNTTKLMLKAKHKGTLNRLNDEVGHHWGNNGDKIYMRAPLQWGNGGPQGGPNSLTVFDLDNKYKPVAVQHSPGPFPDAFNVINQLIMTVPDKLGKLEYRAWNDSLDIDWPIGAEFYSNLAAHHTMNRVNLKAGGIPVPLPTKKTTWHPLGGMTMGHATDFYGRVKGYDNLIIADSSLLPGSCACANPALTVAAIAEHNMDYLLNYSLVS